MKMIPNLLILIPAMMFFIGTAFIPTAHAEQDTPVKTSKPSTDPSVIDPKNYLREPEMDAEVVRNADKTITLRWKIDAQSVTVYGGKALDKIDHKKPLAMVRGKHETSISGIAPAERHYFELKFKGGALDGKSLTVAERFLPTQGAANFRDLGGYRTQDGHHVRWGLIYRSEGLSHLTADDQSLLAEVLKLRSVYDFRDATEIKAQPDRLPSGAMLETVHLPIEASGSVLRQVMAPLFKGDAKAIQEAMAQSYIGMVDAHGEDVFGPFVADMAETKRLPAVYHCTAGKDRTGIATALLLSLLGVPEKTVIADYSLTNRAFDSLMVSLKDNKSLAAAGLTADKMAPLIVADPVWMERTLEHIRKTYGSVESYLKTVGKLDDATITRLRAHLLE